jgi:rhamnogalacturonan endolyase
MHAADVDGDGRDEVLLGSCVLDDDGRPLWTTGLGHPDHSYVGDLDPSRPGLEVYYGIETRNPRNTMCMVDAKTGKILWGFDQPTQHVHSSGLCSDIDPAHPGAECYSGERDFKDKRWLWDCKGKLISHEDLGGLAPRAVWWDADPQRELLVGSRISKYHGQTLSPRIEGSVIAVADVLGDWREEIITSVKGQMRIYTTTIPAADRRVCLMQDPLYRMDVVCAAMGYYQVPMLSYDVASEAHK